MRLVLLTAEPGDPLADETYQGSPLEMLEQAHSFNLDLVAHSRDRKDRNLIFHRNLRLVLDLAWPRLSLERQLQRTWITDTYLCSARTEGGSVPPAAEQYCAASYLRRQLVLFPKSSLVIALGGKAKARADRVGIKAHRVFSVAPPGCHRRAARDSWEQIPRLLAERGLTDGSPDNTRELRARPTWRCRLRHVPQVTLEEWGGHAAHPLPLPARDYRARYCARGMQHGSDLDTSQNPDKPPDSYSLAFWPAPPAASPKSSRGNRPAA